MDSQDIVHGVVSCLAALTRGRCRRVVGPAAAPFGAVMGQRGTGVRRLVQRSWALRPPRAACPHGRVGLGDAEPRRPSRAGAGRGITKGAPCRQQHRAEDGHPRVGFARAHAA
jgi:hypothetical protein